MTLDFTQLAEQVRRMGQEVGARQRTLEERAEAARKKLKQWSDRLEEVQEHVRQAGADFRGAAPLMEPSGEPMAKAVRPPDECPASATVIAVDGSQIYLDQHAPAAYYLTNIGVFTYHHGANRAPEVKLFPQLFYQDIFIYAKGQLVDNAIVNARRTKSEMDYLAESAWNRRKEAHPLLAVADGPLLFWAKAEVPEKERDKLIMPGYYSAMAKLRDIDEMEKTEGRTALVGYVDKPNSTYVIRLLQILSDQENGDEDEGEDEDEILEGLIDRYLFGSKDKPLLAPGERSALFVQQSPYNERYKEYDADLEIAFFYMNTAMPDDPEAYLVRVEVPVWVARDRELVGQVQALLYDQCRLYGRYPYILARADELAVVKGYEKHELDNMIDLALRRQGMRPEEPSVKAAGKSEVWRAPRERHRL